jgi:hypothetical protein|tara:strand:- start:77 stop:361 length:285 start_codon:yes stop_codon:yes gene_type:complete
MKFRNEDLVVFTPVQQKLSEWAEENGKPDPRSWEEEISEIYGGKVMTYSELRGVFFDYYSNRPTVNAEAPSRLQTIQRSLNQWTNAGLIRKVSV